MKRIIKALLAKSYFFILCNIILNEYSSVISVVTLADFFSDFLRDDFVRRERTYGEFKRSFYIDTIDASFTDGVLKVTLPKKEKGVQRKKIDIK